MARIQDTLTTPATYPDVLPRRSESGFAPVVPKAVGRGLEDQQLRKAAVPDSLIVRPGTLEDITGVLALLRLEIDRSVFYNDVFKQQERQRYTPQFLKHLISIDPRFVTVGEVDGAIAGFVIAGPDYGAVSIYWGVVSPQYRRISGPICKGFVESLDNDRWHKIMSLVRPRNRPSALLIAAFGFTKTTRLKSHIFGQDFDLWERFLNKTKPGYEFGYRPGRLGKLREFLRLLTKDPDTGAGAA